MHNERFPIRAAHNVQVSFDSASSEADLVIEHLSNRQLLARECRPLAVGAKALEIKTHPEASHIACSLEAAGGRVDGVRFNVDCRAGIKPVARQFIVIGAMKAGTTTLFNLLAQHPALCQTWVQVPGVSFTKEVNYFRSLYRRGDTSLHYDWRFPFDATKHAWTLDVSPSYAKLSGSKAVPARIASLGGKTKLAYILREPIDRIESHLAHAMRGGGEITNLHHYIRVSRYALHLDRFTAHVAPENILLLNFEQLRRDPDAVLDKVCDFLAIDRFLTSTMVHNRRNVDFRLSVKQRAELAEVLRPDVQRLVSYYGFKPAERWLRGSALRRIRLSGSGR